MKLATLQHAAKQQVATLRNELLTAFSSQLPAMRENLRSLEKSWDLNLLPLTEEGGAYHITASPIARIKAASPQAARLASIMAMPVQQQFDWMCAPVYRDALAFYDDQDNLCAVLNVCFGCDKMITDKQQEIAADAVTCQELKQFMSEVGHSIIER